MPTIDPELMEAVTRLAATMPVVQPPVGDWKTRRSTIDAMYAAIALSTPGEQDVIEEMDFTVTSSDGHLVPMRLFKPPAPHALVVYMHGGGLIAGTVDAYAPLCRRYAAEAGVAVAAVDYRLAPESPHPAGLEDCVAATAWAIEHAAERGLSGGRVVVMGDSAGGGLAATTAIVCRDRGIGPLAAQILIYPMLDDQTVTADPSVEPYLTWSAADNVTGWQAYLGSASGNEGARSYASAARTGSLVGLPRTFVEVGQLDLFASETMVFAARLLRDGVDMQLAVRPGAFHGFDQLAPTSRVARTAFLERATFLRLL